MNKEKNYALYRGEKFLGIGGWFAQIRKENYELTRYYLLHPLRGLG